MVLWGGLSRLWSSGVWCCVACKVDTNILEKHIASVFRIKMCSMRNHLYKGAARKELFCARWGGGPEEWWAEE